MEQEKGDLGSYQEDEMSMGIYPKHVNYSKCDPPSSLPCFEE